MLSNGPGAVPTPSVDVQRKQASANSNSIRQVKPDALLRNINHFSTAETVKVEEPQLFNPIYEEPHQITKIYTGLNCKEKFDEDDDDSNLSDDDYNTDYKQFSKRKMLAKVSHSVEKRNARERTRVHTVNQAFSMLKLRLPSLRTNTKRVSKLKILRTTIDYIETLQNVLKEDDKNFIASFKFNYDSESKITRKNSTNSTLSNINNGTKTKKSSIESTTLPTTELPNSTNFSVNQPIGNNSNSALIKFPYVGYDNFYHPNYMSYAAYMPPTTVSTTITAASTCYMPDTNVFYYQNAQNDYSSLNPTTTFF
uniref:BHLH domain-containing protein n=1 Tax=Panagrolaimus sp. JU765 TaxID=591449 RepID=A0AC34R7T3_9BILA